MQKHKRRTRKLSNPSHQGSKKSLRNIQSKNILNTKLRYIYPQPLNEQNEKICYSFKKIPFNISSSSWCLFNKNNKQLIGYRETQQRQIASLTKIMTTILTLNLMQKYGLEKEVFIKISKTSTIFNGTSAQLRCGKWVRVIDLLYGTMLPSGNDAAFLLSEVMGLLLFYQQMKPEDKQYGDIESIDITLYENTVPFINRFLKQMNKLSKQLKLNHTSFANPHGLANVLNFSSALDLINLTRYACNNKQFMRIANTEEYQCWFYEEDLRSVCDTKSWFNTNRLLRKGWEGVKTGNTSTAGSCLSSVKGGIYIVVLNCSNTETRFTETQRIYQWYVRSLNDGVGQQEVKY